ncbi:sodium/hydrogen exchanger 9B2-like isoform X1 [Acropora muricata]|uniref:sodium/hydrogen exchanger 9B2-like isoform X1 n=1 Tax=Acropora muricata TaxID=159855 RepID=UPI0034E39DBF
MDAKEETSHLSTDCSTPAIENGDKILRPKNHSGTFKNYLFAAGLSLPPSGFCGHVLTRGLIVLLIWAVLWSVIGQDALPGGNMFGIYIVVVFASLFGFIVRNIPHLRLPPLLGMLLAGLLLRNVRGIDFARHIDKRWSSTLRSTALVIILIRSGLGLNTSALRKLKFTLMRLALLPCIFEAIAAAVIVHLLLDMRWLWAFQLGFVQAAVSLAVVIPCLLELQEQGYGINKGIPTLVMAAASFDNVLCISAFGVCLGIAFDSGSLIFSIFRGPIELVLGIAVGGLVGVLCWFIPNKNEEVQVNLPHNRLVILLCFSLLSVFGSNVAKFSGAGALGVLTMSTVAAHGWTHKGKAPVAMVMSLVWQLFEPLLFGLVGAEVSIEYMNTKVVGMGMANLVISLVIRLVTTYLGLLGNDLNLKERLFISISWLPKATVQAAIGSVSLDVARQKGFTGQIEELYGIQILTIAVLVILITSPIGAIGIVVAGPRMLHQSPQEEFNSCLHDSPDIKGANKEKRFAESSV